MAALGAIGTAISGAFPKAGYVYGAPYWFDPSNRAIGIKDYDSKGGAVPGIGGSFLGGIPVDSVLIAVSNFGGGGSIALF